MIWSGFMAVSGQQEKSQLYLSVALALRRSSLDRGEIVLSWEDIEHSGKAETFGAEGGRVRDHTRSNSAPGEEPGSFLRGAGT